MPLIETRPTSSFSDRLTNLSCGSYAITYIWNNGTAPGSHEYHGTEYTNYLVYKTHCGEVISLTSEHRWTREAILNQDVPCKFIPQGTLLTLTV